MDDKTFEEYQSISRRVNQVIKEGEASRSTFKKQPIKKNGNVIAARSRPLTNKQNAALNVVRKQIAQPPRQTNVLKPKNKTFFDLVEKSRALDKRIKQSRRDGKEAKDRLQDLEEFSKISEEMENLD